MTPDEWHYFDKLPKELRDFFNQFEYGDLDALKYAIWASREGFPYNLITHRIRETYSLMERLDAARMAL